MNYYVKSKSIYNIHSPFVFEFVKDIIEDERNFYAFDLIKKIKYDLKQRQTTIKLNDLGAGSLVSTTNERTIAEIVNNSVASQKKIQFLFKLCLKYQPETILELGTSLGLSSLVMQLANIRSTITTVEGDATIADIAHNIHTENNIHTIEIVNQPFDVFLKNKNTDSKFKLILIDGNHAYSPTIKYFEILTHNIDNECIMIFDDINWSQDMRRAWDEIKSNKKVRLSIETFEYGIVFFNSDFKEKQHFNIIPKKWKPFNIGLF